MLGFGAIVLACTYLRAAVGLVECGSPSSPQFTSGVSCSGCAFTGMNLNSLNTLGSESGCLAAVSGASTQLNGYPCVTVQSSGGKVTSCTIHKTCGIQNATDSTSKSCLFTLGGFSGVKKPSECPVDEVCSGGNGVHTSGAKGLSLSFIFLVIACFRAALGLVECGSPSSPQFTSGVSCSGCAFTGMNLNSLNTLGSESGCLAAVSGASTQLNGYPCVTVKSSGGKVTSCTIHRTCGTQNATDSTSKSCLFTLGGFSGVKKTSECPVDEVCSGGNGVHTSGVKKWFLSLAAIGAVVILALIQ